MLTLKEYVKTNQIMIVAHRGASGTAPENTLAAFNQAIDAGSAMIELDVQVSADGDPVVFHDSVLGRTTDGSGKVAHSHTSDLLKLDAGAWFDRKFSGEKIPLLEEALRVLHGKVYVNIEIKPPKAGVDFFKQVNAIVNAVASADFTPYTLFSSFHHDSLKYIKSLPQGFHTAAINLPNDLTLPSVLSQKIGCEAFVCSLREFTRKRSADALENGIFTGVYTINTREELLKALSRHVRAIVTNFPVKIQQELENIIRDRSI